jgi:sulfite exporter TauE/SafE
VSSIPTSTIHRPTIDPPRLILITGIMAAGKSTVAQHLAERLPHSVHLRGDVFRRMMVNGRAEMTRELSVAAAEQLQLLYRLAETAGAKERDAEEIARVGTARGDELQGRRFAVLPVRPPDGLRFLHHTGVLQDGIDLRVSQVEQDILPGGMFGLFGLLGGVVIETVARFALAWNLLIAALLIGFGLILLRLVTLQWPVLRVTWRKAHTVPGAYGLGVPFGLAACPACMPMILPMLGAAAATGSWWFGALLMFVFGLARGLPLLLVGASAGWFARLGAASRWVPRVQAGAGALLLLAGLFFLFEAGQTAVLFINAS